MKKGKRYPAEPLTESEVRLLLARCSRRAPSGIRNRALITVLYRGGLRIGEALALRLKDIDFEKGSVRILHGKGDKARLVGLDDGCLEVLRAWLDCRRRMGIDNRLPIFSTLKGGPLSDSYVRTMLRRIGAKAGIAKRVHPHGLRHTHAFELANEGTPLHVIQQQLGHASLAVTDTYIRHLAPQDVIKTMRLRIWQPEEAA